MSRHPEREADKGRHRSIGSGGVTPAVIRPAAADGNSATIPDLVRISKRELYARHASRLLP